MCEWERSKKPAPPSADKPEEGSSEAAASEPQEAQSAPEGESSCQRPPASAGVTYELCAGLVDKPDLSLEEIARQEVLEECGYDVPASKLKRITSYRLVRWRQPVPSEMISRLYRTCPYSKPPTL